ncbi:hypothetical protein [Haloprofundus marisrubri]|uniref:hypothetical protein n=1 Tax=Haloprofundus marisrubri TaxID=1514971 RepID=UPI001F0B1B0D|nr:hypothetical protein [Haloprofundus marisrubri]
MTDSNSTPRTDRTDDSGTDDSAADAPNNEPASDARSTTPTQEQSRQPASRTDQTTHAEKQRRVDGDDAAFHCRHCGDPFVEERHLALHRGLRHADDLSAEELEAYRDAYADEEADLKRFRLVALGALVVLYFGFLFVYALVP